MRRALPVLALVIVIALLVLRGGFSGLRESSEEVSPAMTGTVAPAPASALGPVAGVVPASAESPTSSVVAEEHPPGETVGGPGITLERIPPGDFRSALAALEPSARARALETLRKHPVPAQQLDHLAVRPSGGIYFRHCPQAIPPASAAGNPTPAAALPATRAASVPVSQPPLFHSRPGAARVLFLDFNGATINKVDVDWDTLNPDNVLEARPFSIDGDYTTFSDADQSAIQAIWKRVAEDFVSFEIDVTTEDPGTANYQTMHQKIGWVIITDELDPRGYDLPHAGSGGIAYLGVFDEWTYRAYRPAWVTDYHSAAQVQYMASSCAHEFGHNLGLSHDGTATQEYYRGHGSGVTSWGPIMGAASKSVDQWSKGQYSQANNVEDDLAIIAASLPYRSDDHNNSLATADLVTVTSASTFTATGVIEATGDVDAFRVIVGAGPLTATVAGLDSGVGTNLAAGLELWTQAGALVTSLAPTTTMGVTLSTTVTAGTYVLKVVPAGLGSPLSASPSGFTAYGSLGQYTITGTCTSAIAEIEVRGNRQIITAGDTTPSTTDDTSFGTLVRGGTVTRTFAIANLGGADLTGVSASVSGAGFTITGTPAATVAPQGSTSVVITYTAGLGTANGTVTIHSNDPDEGTTTFAIQGIGTSAVTLDAGTFTEDAVANHGACLGTVTATLAGDTFVGVDSADLAASGAVTVTGLPLGLTMSAIRTSSSTLTMSLGGAAVHHDQSDSTTATLTFTDGAFSAGNAAGHTGASSSLTITFTGLTVTTASDTGVDATLGASLAVDLGDGAGLSLREALGWTTGGPITFAEGLGTITLGGSHLLVSRSVTVDGGGVVTLDANLASRVLMITAGTVAVRNLTLTRGLVTGIGTVSGGAVAVTGGSLTLERVVISDSTASSSSFPAYGGGVYISGGNLTILDSTITGCAARTLSYLNAVDNARGGAIASLNASGTVTIDGCQISGNTAGDTQASPTSGYGGGLYAGAAGNLVIRQTTFANNTAANAGGGLCLKNTGIVTCTGGTFSGNRTQAVTSGGGGAIMTSGAAGFSLRNSTVTANTAATGFGHGFFAGGSRSHTLTSTICAANPSVGAQGTDLILTGTGSFVADASLISTTRQGRSGSQTITNSASCVDALDPGLSILGDHGGRVWTHTLLAGSPAAEAGANPAALTVDQRGSGFARVVGGAIDIGAVENQRPTLGSSATVTVVMSKDGAPTAWSAPALGVLDSDTSSASTDLVWSVVTPPTHGTATFTQGSAASLAYLPAVGWSGTDSFTVQVSDGLLAAAEVVTITVQVIDPSQVLPAFQTVQVTLRGTVDVGTVSLRLGATAVPIASDHTWIITIPAPATVTTYDLTATSADGHTTIRHLTISPVTPPGAG